jgi:hypothetical protein
MRFSSIFCCVLPQSLIFFINSSAIGIFALKPILKKSGRYLGRELYVIVLLVEIRFEILVSKCDQRYIVLNYKNFNDKQ